TGAAGQRDLPWTMQDEEVTKFLDDFKQEMEWQEWQWSDVTWRSWSQEEWKEKTPDEKVRDEFWELDYEITTIFLDFNFDRNAWIANCLQLSNLK
ncbi:unnamed protein product, partial [Durusdinium trenchii]